MTAKLRHCKLKSKIILFNLIKYLPWVYHFENFHSTLFFHYYLSVLSSFSSNIRKSFTLLTYAKTARKTSWEPKQKQKQSRDNSPTRRTGMKICANFQCESKKSHNLSGFPPSNSVCFEICAKRFRCCCCFCSYLQSIRSCVSVVNKLAYNWM